MKEMKLIDILCEMRDKSNKSLKREYEREPYKEMGDRIPQEIGDDLAKRNQKNREWAEKRGRKSYELGHDWGSGRWPPEEGDLEYDAIRIDSRLAGAAERAKEMIPTLEAFIHAAKSRNYEEATRALDELEEIQGDMRTLRDILAKRISGTPDGKAAPENWRDYYEK